MIFLFDSEIHVSNPIIFIIWLVFLALGCFGPVYTLNGGNRYFGWGGSLFLFIAILMVKLVAF
jgi:hypothetical protein